MGVSQLAKESDRLATPLVVGPAGRVEPQGRLNGLPLSGESQASLLLPIGSVGVDGVVGQSDRVHDVKLGLKTPSKVCCHSQSALACRACVVSQHEMNGALPGWRARVRCTNMIAGTIIRFIHVAASQGFDIASGLSQNVTTDPQNHRPDGGTAYGDAAGQRWCRGGAVSV